MQVPVRTFALFTVAFGILAAGYLLRPSPGEAALPPSPPPAAKVAAATPAPAPALAAAPAAKPVPTVLANRAPVPFSAPQHATYYENTQASTTPAADGTTDSSKALTADQNQPQTAALTTDENSPANADAKRAIEFDGYRNVRDIVKASDGSYKARAMRGRTEITVTVDASGNVSAN